jgi:hypothetical protein
MASGGMLGRSPPFELHSPRAFTKPSSLKPTQCPKHPKDLLKPCNPEGTLQIQSGDSCIPGQQLSPWSKKTHFSEETQNSRTAWLHARVPQHVRECWQSHLPSQAAGEEVVRKSISQLVRWRQEDPHSPWFTIKIRLLFANTCSLWFHVVYQALTAALKR